MSDDTHRYPSEIKQDWAEVIERQDLSPEEADSIAKIIAYVQPPLSLYALSQSMEIYCHDNNTRIHSNFIKKLDNSGYVSHTIPKRIATSHPVYFAFVHANKLGKLSCHKTLYARKTLSRTFQEAAPGGMVSRSQFYQHTIAVRDVLITLIASGIMPCGNNGHDINIQLLDAIRSDLIYGQTDEILARKIKNFSLLINGELEPGEIQREGSGGGSGYGRASTKKQDVWHEKRVKKLAQKTRKPLKKSILESNNTLPHSDMSMSEFQKMDLKPHQGTNSRRATKDDSDILYLRRTTASSLTPTDDRQLVRYCLAAAPTSSIKSVSNMSRLTPDCVNQIMQAPITPICHIYASILLSTGLPTLRLTRLTVCEEHSLENILQHGDKRPYWIPELALLCYRLLDGPSHNEYHPAYSWIILTLPESVNSSLIRAKSAIQKRPFMGARAELNQQLIRLFKKTPGIMPTANRLSASSWLYCRTHAIDDIAAAGLSGKFGLGMSAPAAYRKISRQEHQSIFNNVLRELGWNIPISEAKMLGLEEINDLNLATVGSTAARTPDEFSDMFEQLKTAMYVPSVHLSGWWSGERIPLAAVAELHQLVSAYEMLAWHLSSGGRPIGPGSKNHLNGALQWVYDKNSTIGRESRVIPLLATVRQSLEYYHSWTHAIISRLKKNGVHVDDQRTLLRQTPSWMELTKHGKVLRIRDMFWRDVTSISVINDKKWASNVCRHSIASWLRQHAPDAQVDHLLGHARHGRMLSSIQSEAPLGHQHALRKKLTEWLKTCGYRPFNWRNMPWK